MLAMARSSAVRPPLIEALMYKNEIAHGGGKVEVARCLCEVIGDGRVDLSVVSTPDSESTAKIGPRIEENLKQN